MGLTGWMRARRSDSARDEGLAAGTGLLTGLLADRSTRSPRAGELECPACGHRAAFTDVIDLVEHRTFHRCAACRHRWAAAAGSRDD